MSHGTMARPFSITPTTTAPRGRRKPAAPRGAMRILESMPTAVVVIGRSSVVRFANDRAADVLKRSRQDIVGRSSRDLFGAPAIEDEEVADDAIEERRIRRPDGTSITIGYAISHSKGDAVVVFRDVSRVVEIREERDRLMRLAAIGEALPSLLHELKNPLAAVTTAVEVLLEEVFDEDVRDQLHAVLSEVRRMKLGFEGIGAVGRTLRGSGRHAAVDYAIREACRVLEARTKNAGIVFRYDVSNMPLLPLDPAVVRAMVFNFVTNAVHACDRGDTIALHADLRDGHLELVVVDTGTGMSPEVLASSTRLFFTTKASGSGIGLALCKRALEEAGGELELSSVPGFGTSICARVPTVEDGGTS